MAHSVHGTIVPFVQSRSPITPHSPIPVPPMTPPAKSKFHSGPWVTAVPIPGHVWPFSSSRSLRRALFFASTFILPWEGLHADVVLYENLNFTSANTSRTNINDQAAALVRNCTSEKISAKYSFHCR